MRKISLLLLVCLSTMYAFGQTEASTAANPPIIGITWARGVAPDLSLAPARRSPRPRLAQTGPNSTGAPDVASMHGHGLLRQERHGQLLRGLEQLQLRQDQH